MPEPPKMQESLGISSLRSNVKSLSSNNRVKDGVVAQLPLCILIGLFGVVYGITKSYDLLPIIQMLVTGLLCVMGLAQLTPPVKPD